MGRGDDTSTLGLVGRTAGRLTAALRPRPEAATFLVLLPASADRRAELAAHAQIAPADVPPTISENTTRFLLDEKPEAARHAVASAGQRWTSQGEQVAPWDGSLRIAEALVEVADKLPSFDDGLLLQRIDGELAPHADGRPRIYSASAVALLDRLGIDPWSPQAKQARADLDRLADQISRAEICAATNALTDFFGQTMHLTRPDIRHALHRLLPATADALLPLTPETLTTEATRQVAATLADALFVRHRDECWGGIAGIRDGEHPSADQAVALLEWAADQGFDDWAATLLRTGSPAGWTQFTSP